MMQGWKVAAAKRIFLCSGRSLPKRGKTLGAASVFRPILEIWGHSTSQHRLSHRDLSHATMCRQGCRGMRYDAFDFC